MEPPRDLTLENIPLDIKEESSLKLEYPNLLNLCKTNKQLSFICRDPEFWRRKILYDFPSEKILNISKDKYRAFYERLYAMELENDMEELRKEHSKQIQQLYAEQAEELKNLKNKIKLLKGRASILTYDIDRRYIEIRVSRDNILKLDRLLKRMKKEDNNSFTRLSLDLNPQYLYFRDFKPGNLIGIISESNKTNMILILIYLYGSEMLNDYYDMRFDYIIDLQTGVNKYPQKLVESMEKDGYNARDIPEVYKLPFKLNI